MRVNYSKSEQLIQGIFTHVKKNVYETYFWLKEPSGGTFRRSREVFLRNFLQQTHPQGQKTTSGISLNLLQTSRYNEKQPLPTVLGNRLPPFSLI